MAIEAIANRPALHGRSRCDGAWRRLASRGVPCTVAWRRPDSRGSSAVESALSLGLLFLMLLGVFDLGRATYAYSNIAQAAREGARYAVSHPGDVGGAQQAAMRWTSLGLSAANIGVAFKGGPPATVEVTVTYNYRAISPWIAAVAGGPAGLALVSRSTMLVE